MDKNLKSVITREIITNKTELFSTESVESLVVNNILSYDDAATSLESIESGEVKPNENTPSVDERMFLNCAIAAAAEDGSNLHADYIKIQEALNDITGKIAQEYGPMVRSTVEEIAAGTDGTIGEEMKALGETLAGNDRFV